MSAELLEKAREFQMAMFLGRHGIGKKKIKKCTCNICGRDMETKEDENPPYYCWKCGDKHGLGGYWEI